MCAKVAQKHETKEERVKKSFKSFVISHILCTFAPDPMILFDYICKLI